MPTADSCVSQNFLLYRRGGTGVDRIYGGGGTNSGERGLRVWSVRRGGVGAFATDDDGDRTRQ
jgi:hypothetical protein